MRDAHFCSCSLHSQTKMARRYIKNCTGEMEEKREIMSDTASRFIFRLLLIGFVGVSTYILLFSDYLKITYVEITGTKELSSEDIRQKLGDFLGKKTLKIIPNDNFLFVSEKRVSSLLENDFKKIRSASVAKKFTNSLSVSIEERQAVLVWCAGEKCFLIDENGVAYNEADFNSPEILQNHLVRINDQSRREIALKEKIIEHEYEQYALGIKENLKNIGQEIVEENYATPSNMAEEIRVPMQKGFQIYFSSQYSLEKAVRALDIVLKKEIPENEWEKLEYIDLRSEGKVFYKFKNEEEKKPEEVQDENQNQK